MTTNQYYYEDGVATTSEKAHANPDKSKLVVADKALTKTQCKTALGTSEVSE